MTQHDDMLYVALMRDEIRGAMEAVAGTTREQFAADRTGPHVAAYHFVRLAERPLKASAAFRTAHPEIPWQDLAGIRNRVEDEHFNENAEEIWDIAGSEFPPILERLEALLPADPLWRYRAEDDEELSEQPDSAVTSVDDEAERRFLSLFNGQTDALDRLCREYDVRSIRLFGSVLREDFRADSDVDMMVEFGPGVPPGWAVFGFDDQMTELLGHPADVMHGRPVRYTRDRILAEARTVYVAGERLSPRE